MKKFNQNSLAEHSGQWGFCILIRWTGFVGRQSGKIYLEQVARIYLVLNFCEVKNFILYHYTIIVVAPTHFINGIHFGAINFGDKYFR